MRLNLAMAAALAALAAPAPSFRPLNYRRPSSGDNHRAAPKDKAKRKAQRKARRINRSKS